MIHIQTALEHALVVLSKGRDLVAERTSNSQKDHAAFLHQAIHEMLTVSRVDISELSAVSVVSGPGSYTGLRVGLSCAKGLCYALDLPMITINTLEWMAEAVLVNRSELRCPMIDARRMEVFTALYGADRSPILAPLAMQLEPGSFSNWIDDNKILFFGNGSEKFRVHMNHPNASFIEMKPGSRELVDISLRKFEARDFSELTDSEPLYLKEFHSTKPV
jgi:tRNA threonylcarbamoyladenosine biosynthesis protein TsaB